MAELIQIENGVSSIRFNIDKPIIRIGRHAKLNDICIPDAYVSKEHAVIEVRARAENENGCDFFLRDLGSTNHTFVNQERVSAYQQLYNHDLISIGRNLFRFVCSEHETLRTLKGNGDDTLEFEKPGRNTTSGFSRRLRVIR